MNRNTTKNCPKCGGIIPPDAPQELCPACVLARAFEGSNSRQPMTATAEMPSLETVARAFPQLEILELLGKGGMGFVFKARQPQLDRFVALKILPDKMARDPQFAERFNREGRVLARLNHPNIVNIYDFGQSGGFCFLMLEYVDGLNLRQAMQAGRFSPAEALSIVPRICEALQYAHEQGVLHRDIKPENILLDIKGRVKIADFGIAKLIGEGKPDFTLTLTGTALGTPHYMAPEQFEKPAEVDHRADIYSLGVVFYEMLTGELPIGRFAPPSAKTPVNEFVDEVVLRALEKEREDRFQSANEVKTSVEGLSADPPPQKKPVSEKPVPAQSFRWSAEQLPYVAVGALGLLSFACKEVPDQTLQQLKFFSGFLNSGATGLMMVLTLAAAEFFAIGLVWRRRRSILTAIGLDADTVTGMRPRWAREILLLAPIMILTAGAAILGCQVTFMVNALVSSLAGIAGNSTSALAILFAAGFGLAAWRFTDFQDDESSEIQSYHPAWMRRLGMLFLVLAVALWMARLLKLEHTQWSGLPAVVFAGLALLKQNRPLRRLALLIAWVFSALSLCNLLIGLVSVFQRYEVSGFSAVKWGSGTIQVLHLVLFILIIVCLSHRDVKYSLGLSKTPPDSMPLGPRGTVVT